MTKIAVETKLLNSVLIVTNDSTVFLVRNRIDSAFNMFGGRVTEVKNLVKRLDTAVKNDGSKLCDVSFGIITTRYGFVPANYQIEDYPRVMSNKEEYEAEIDTREKERVVVGYFRDYTMNKIRRRGLSREALNTIYRLIQEELN